MKLDAEHSVKGAGEMGSATVPVALLRVSGSRIPCVRSKIGKNALTDARQCVPTTEQRVQTSSARISRVLTRFGRFCFSLFHLVSACFTYEEFFSKWATKVTLLIKLAQKSRKFLTITHQRALQQRCLARAGQEWNWGAHASRVPRSASRRTEKDPEAPGETPGAATETVALPKLLSLLHCWPSLKNVFCRAPSTSNRDLSDHRFYIISCSNQTT